MKDFAGDIVAVLKSVSESEWSLLFRELRENKMMQLVGTADEDLSKLKAKVEMINEIEMIFRSQRSRKNFD